MTAPRLLVSMGAAERAALDAARDAGRPGYWDAVNEMLSVAADSVDPANVERSRALLDTVARDVMETVRQARVYVRSKAA